MEALKKSPLSHDSRIGRKYRAKSYLKRPKRMTQHPKYPKIPQSRLLTKEPKLDKQMPIKKPMFNSKSEKGQGQSQTCRVPLATFSRNLELGIGYSACYSRPI